MSGDRNCRPVAASSRGTSVCTFEASSTPSVTPTTVPMMPITEPCTMNTAMTERGVAPSVRMIAISACLSCTTITSVETMLNAAMPTSSERIRNITVFSVATARKKFAWLRVQSLTK